MIFESEWGLKITEAPSAPKAIEILKDNSFDFIVSDYNMPEGNGDKLYEYVKENTPDTPFFFFTTEDIQAHDHLKTFFKDNPRNAHFPKPLVNENFKEALLGLTRESSGEIDLPSSSDYFGISLERLSQFNEICADLYLKLSEKKFVRILKKHELFESSFIEKYQDRGVSHFYLTKDEYYTFMRKLTTSLASKLQDSGATPHAHVKTQVDVYEHIHESLKKIGLSEHYITLAKKTFEASLKVFNNSPNLMDLLKEVLERKDYIIEHSIMTSYFCFFIAEKMEWNTTKTLAKLNFAALFHDVALDSEELAKIPNKNCEEFKALSRTQQTLFLEHPLKAANFVKSIPNGPENVDMVVLQHHELPDGTGFPKQLTAGQMAPMACVFILAHTMAQHLYANGFSRDSVEEYIGIVTQEYDKGNFKKPLKGLLDAFL